MIPDWKCCVCGKDADYSQGRRKYCTEHWNYGQPISRETKTEVTAQEEVTHGK